jgi:uracil-DNA glycosylase family 4
VKSVQLVSVKKRLEKSSGRKGCQHCGLKGSVQVLPENIGEPKFLVIGEAPGKQEEKMGRPFIGPTGSLLREVLQELPYGCRLTNAVRCFPKDKEGKGRAPTDGEVRTCREYLIEEIERFSYVLVVGGVALKSVFPSCEHDITEVSGSVLVDKEGRKFLAVVHPSFVYRQLTDKVEKDDKVYKNWVKEVKRIVDLIEEKEKPFRVQVVNSENCHRVKEYLGSQKEIVLDVEASSLDVFNCVVYSVSLTGIEGDTVYVFNLETLREVWSEIEKKIVILHNALFDYRVLYQKGFSLAHAKKIYDTMLMASTVDQNRVYSSFKLKELARVYLKYRYWALIPNLQEIDQYEPKVVQEYNAEDVYVTRELYRYFVQRLCSERQIEFFDKVLSSGIKAVAEIEDTGILVDTDRVTQSITVCEEHCRKAKEEIEGICKEFGAEDLSITSSVQVGKFIESRFKEDVGVLYRTETGRVSVNEHSLTKLVEVLESKNQKLSRFVKLLLEYRQWEKLRGTFLSGFVKYLSGDRRVRSSYNMVGARTGRMSSSEPNLQNVPKNLRNVFVPRVGYKFVESDLSQIELRVAGMIAQDQTLIQAYRAGEDIHKLTASMVSGVQKELVDESMRQRAKAVNFGFLYGMYSDSFREYAKTQYGVEYSEKEAEDARKRFFQLYAGIAKWHKSTEETVRRYGYVESPFGRVYVFDKEKHYDFNSAVRKALNYPVQGTAADLNLYLMGRLFEWKIENGIEMYIVGTVHDSVLMEVKEGFVEEVVEKVKEVVRGIEEAFDWVILPVDAEVKVKDAW